MTPTIGHNQPSFDDIVADNLRRGLYYTQRDVLINCIRDERLSQRHRLTLAAIIEHMNVRDGMAYPGRRALAQSTVWYDHEWIERHYTEAGISKTISELIDFGYLAVARRAPEGGKRALSHYTIVKRSPEELQAEVSAYIEEIRRKGTKPLPAFSKDSADLTPVGNVTPVGNDSEAVLTPVVPAVLTPVSPTVTSRGTRREEGGKAEVTNESVVANATPSRSKRGSRLPEDWTLPGAGRCYAQSRGLSERQIDAVAKKFHNYWLAESGKHAVKLRWDLTWQNWVDKQIDEYGLKPEGGSAPAGSSDLDGKVAAVLNSDLGRHMVSEYGAGRAREKIREDLLRQEVQDAST